MTQEVLNKLNGIQETLARREIYQPNGQTFGPRWTKAMIKAFNGTPQPMSIKYRVNMKINLHIYDGEIEITNDGELICRLMH